MPTLAYSYQRISSTRQLDGVGLERQDERTLALCQKHNWTLDESTTLIDPGRSGYHGKHLGPSAALGRFMAMVAEGRIPQGSVLVIENLDRLSRQEVELSMSLFLGLVAAGIQIATTQPEIIYRSPLRHDAFLALGEFIRGHSESATKASRGSHRWQTNHQKARQGTIVTANGPRWLRADRKANVWHPIPERVEVVRRIFRMCLEGLGVSQIIHQLNEEQVPPFDDRKRKGKGRAVWTARYVLLILRGRAVLGELQPGGWEHQKTDRGTVLRRVTKGSPIQGYYPAVIDETTYYRAQAALDGRRRQPGPRKGVGNLFAGMVYDAEHRCPCYVAKKGHHGDHDRQLISEVWFHKKRERGTVPTVHYPRVEKLILDLMMDVRPSQLVPGHSGDRLASLSRELTELDATIRAIEKRLKGPRTDEMLDLLEREHFPERDRLREALQAEKARSANGSADLLGQMQTYAQRLASTPEKDRQAERQRIKALAPQLISEIWVLVGMSDRRINRHRPKAIFLEVHFRTGAVMQCVTDWICWPHQRDLGIRFVGTGQPDGRPTLKGSADVEWARKELKAQEGKRAPWDGRSQDLRSISVPPPPPEPETDPADIPPGPKYLELQKKEQEAKPAAEKAAKKKQK